MNIPAIDNVTTDVVEISANSKFTIVNAIHPPNDTTSNNQIESEKVAKCGLAKRAENPSRVIKLKNNDTAIIGAMNKLVASGLFIPIFSFSSNTWVIAHLNPDKTVAIWICAYPKASNLVSFATIIPTPAQMTITAIVILHEGFSNPNRNANNNTKTGADINEKYLLISPSYKMIVR